MSLDVDEYADAAQLRTLKAFRRLMYLEVHPPLG